MPKIPTFQTQATPTTQVASIKTDLKVSPTKTTAAALLPAAQAVDDYYVKQRDNNEKLEAKKKFYEMKAESDKIIEKQKNNTDEFGAIESYNSKFGEYRKQQLSQIKNSRVKKKLELLLDSDQAENVYKIKSNSFKAFETESLSVYNTDQNTLSSKYSLESNPELKVKYKQQRIESAKEFSETHQMGSAWLSKEIKKIETDSVLIDADIAIANKQYGLAQNILKQAKGVDAEQVQKRIVKIAKEGAEYAETNYHVGNLINGNNTTIGATYKSTTEKKVLQQTDKVLFNNASKNNLGSEQTFAYVDETFAKNGIVSPTYKDLIEKGYNTGSTTTFDSAADIPPTLTQAVKAAETADKLGRLGSYATDSKQERFYKNVIVAKQVLGMNDFQAIKAAKEFEKNYNVNTIKGSSKRRKKTLEEVENHFSNIKTSNIGEVKVYAQQIYDMYVTLGLDDRKAQEQVIKDLKANIVTVDDHAYLKRDIEAFKSIGSVEAVPALKKYMVGFFLEEGQDSKDYYLRHNGGGQFEMRRKLDTAPVYDKDGNPMIFYASDLKSIQSYKDIKFREEKKKEVFQTQKQISKKEKTLEELKKPVVKSGFGEPIK